MQVTNRDLSVAVLRHFIPQMQQEIDSRTLKRSRPRQKQQAGAAAGAAAQQDEQVIDSNVKTRQFDRINCTWLVLVMDDVHGWFCYGLHAVLTY